MMHGRRSSLNMFGAYLPSGKENPTSFSSFSSEDRQAKRHRQRHIDEKQRPQLVKPPIKSFSSSSCSIARSKDSKTSSSSSSYSSSLSSLSIWSSNRYRNISESPSAIPAKTAWPSHAFKEIEQNEEQGLEERSKSGGASHPMWHERRFSSVRHPINTSLESIAAGTAMTSSPLATSSLSASSNWRSSSSSYKSLSNAYPKWKTPKMDAVQQSIEHRQPAHTSITEPVSSSSLNSSPLPPYVHGLDVERLTAGLEERLIALEKRGRVRLKDKHTPTDMKMDHDNQQKKGDVNSKGTCAFVCFLHFI